MKYVTAFACTLILVIYSTDATYAQGRGNGRGPSVSSAARRGPSPQTQRAKSQPKRAPETNNVTIAHRIEQNPQLNTRLTAMLPAGTDMQTAASGFKNRGQFIAALNVSKNLNVSFDELKARVTGPDARSLGDAIRELKPSLSETEADQEATKAEKQAEALSK